jgi:hypothetical protein
MSPYDRDPPDPGRTPARPAPRCPVCAKPRAPRYQPFCSKRCADVDLHRWLAGVYRVETQEAPETADAPDRE